MRAIHSHAIKSSLSAQNGFDFGNDVFHCETEMFEECSRRCGFAKWSSCRQRRHPVRHICARNPKRQLQWQLSAIPSAKRCFYKEHPACQICRKTASKRPGPRCFSLPVHQPISSPVRLPNPLQSESLWHPACLSAHNRPC